MSEYLAKLSDALSSIENLPYLPLVFLSCIVMGWLLKRWSRYPNGCIPFAVVIMGVLNTCLLSLPMPQGELLVAWLIRKSLIGLIVGFLAWTAHAQVLKRITGYVAGGRKKEDE